MMQSPANPTIPAHLILLAPSQSAVHSELTLITCGLYFWRNSGIIESWAQCLHVVICCNTIPSILLDHVTLVCSKNYLLNSAGNHYYVLPCSTQYSWPVASGWKEKCKFKVKCFSCVRDCWFCSCSFCNYTFRLVACLSQSTPWLQFQI